MNSAKKLEQLITKPMALDGFIAATRITLENNPREDDPNGYDAAKVILMFATAVKRDLAVLNARLDKLERRLEQAIDVLDQKGQLKVADSRPLAEYRVGVTLAANLKDEGLGAPKT